MIKHMVDVYIVTDSYQIQTLNKYKELKEQTREFDQRNGNLQRRIEQILQLVNPNINNN